MSSNLTSFILMINIEQSVKDEKKNFISYQTSVLASKKNIGIFHLRPQKILETCCSCLFYN
ncbi:hypothetical protein BpHYR1_028356 [Brachionus plicatilis]|uniref:Uncharacterized protein n=1 Tax=Brachionus plicatilis TaxID=10195 RepID=A0A3M7QFX2_BRAPC|nr:hypothetical protein BpHYR1_028356 [Brachionus plicatilis]